MDSDGDGVYDYVDSCPDTPADYVVDSAGCSLEAVDAVNSDLIDSDADGIYDYIDRCPDTPAGQAVNNLGCAL